MNSGWMVTGYCISDVGADSARVQGTYKLQRVILEEVPQKRDKLRNHQGVIGKGGGTGKANQGDKRTTFLIETLNEEYQNLYRIRNRKKNRRLAS